MEDCELYRQKKKLQKALPSYQALPIALCAGREEDALRN